MKQEEAKGVRAFAPIFEGPKLREHEGIMKSSVNLNEGKRKRRKNSWLGRARSPWPKGNRGERILVSNNHKRYSCIP